MGLHNIVEVGKEDFEACTQNKVIEIYYKGPTILNFTQPGTHYYYSGIGTQCELGQKLSVTVVRGKGSSGRTRRHLLELMAPAPSPSTAAPIAVEKEKNVVGNMKGDGELEMLLNEIPHVTSHNYHPHHQNMHYLLTSVSPSSSFSSSAGLCSSEDGFSPSLTPFDESMYRAPSTHYVDSRVVKNSNEYMVDEYGLSERLPRMHIGDEHKDRSKVMRFQMDADGFGLGNRSLDSVYLRNSENYCPFEGFNGDVHDYGGFHSSVQGHYTSFDDARKTTLLGLPQGYNLSNSMGSYLTHNQSNVLYSDPSCYKERIDDLMEQTKGQRRGYCNNGVQLHSPSMSRSYLNDDFCCSQQYGLNSNGDRGIFNPLNSSHLMHPELASSVESPIYNRSMLEQNSRAFPNGKVPPSLLSMTDTGDLEAFSCEDSFIIQGKNLKYVVDKGRDRSKGQKKNYHNEIAMPNPREKRPELHVQSRLGGICENGLSPRNSSPLFLQSIYSSLAEVQGYIYFTAKDQHGCRFLQRIFDEGSRQDVQIIFNELIDHVVELMMNPFGNYLMQKLLDVCCEEQRMQIVLMVTEEPRELVKISLNTHGTRVVQKLIETLKTRQQISLVVSALKPAFLDLIKDPNGNHVVQRCLQCLGKEDNKFIFDAAAKFCVDIATHRHGCCVLNRCIAHSIGKHREKLAIEIAANGLILAQDAFGNYVVQYIIELNIPSVAACLISQFEGHYVYLSMQKFSSHVIEKCLKCSEESRAIIIHELLSVPHFEQLLQDPFANYVIQSALEFTKGSLHASLVEAVRPHMILRTSPYCKKIFSCNLLKK
ncbi:hypothetical protein F0562_035481 [Nyssa sinensis]|uniref:PUM-HD domain-containing protein n=1 Tax=Nyssa sinensis TaxID=561372 RepID=A0A5J5ADM5_9ASTE|nr:hypothetical protein F0562_035481 [Nyssa sinensis]